MPRFLEADSLACYVIAVYIKTLTAQNFRCFTDLTIDFQPGVNLLIGDNMSGKTAVLDALRICLNQYVNTSHLDGINIEEKDVRLILRPSGGSFEMVKQKESHVGCEVKFVGDFEKYIADRRHRIKSNSSIITAGQATLNHKEGSVRKNDNGLESLGETVEQDLSLGSSVEPPVVAFYGTSRNSQRIDELAEARSAIPERFSRGHGYENCLSDLSSLPMIRSWMERRTLSELQRKQRGLPVMEAGPLLGIEAAVKTCLPELKQFYFDFEFQDLTVVFQDDRRLPWTMLSDGMRSVISLAMDIAWRAVVLNPHLGAKAPELATGIVMIDELDLALHPTWQRRIVADLSRAFPGLQFIATTHSPQIIGSAKHALVQKIDGDKVQAVARPFGLDSNTLLTEVMGAQERDPQIVALFEEVNGLMNDKRWDEARAALARVTDQIDSLDTEVVSLRARIDFLSRAAKRS